MTILQPYQHYNFLVVVLFQAHFRYVFMCCEVKHSVRMYQMKWSYFKACYIIKEIHGYFTSYAVIKYVLLFS
jgi:hypothetical protein